MKTSNNIGTKHLGQRMMKLYNFGVKVKKSRGKVSASTLPVNDGSTEVPVENGRMLVSTVVNCFYSSNNAC